MAKMIKGLIKNIEMLKANICRIDFESKELAGEALPGQFLNVRCGNSLAPLLRRPISICNIDKNNNIITIIFQIKAVGTTILSKMKTGEELDVLGPLGKGFDMSSKYKNILVVGGGIGIFPLLYLLKDSKASFKSAFLGFRSRDFVVMESEFSDAVSKSEGTLKIFTDDGSYGEKGVVLKGLTEYIKANSIDIVYSCGPSIMLKNVVQAVKEVGVLCQISVEQRMGCGIGACLVCACKAKVKENGESDEDFTYRHVCKDGPVFWADELIFD